MSILDQETKSNDLVTISDLFSGNRYYRIPDYQRGYSWGADKEFLELWKDILRLFHASKSDRKHYTGMITLDEIKEDSDKGIECLYDTDSFYIVDGQQRITSLVIMLKSIIDYAKDNELPSIVAKEDLRFLLKGDSGIRRFGYSTKREDRADEFFEKRIYESNKNLPTPNHYFANIDDAQRLIEKELDRYDEDKIGEIVDIILHRLVFNLYFITEGFDVRVTFETMNNRGKPLTNLELLKNRLMYLTTFFEKGRDNYGRMLQGLIDRTWRNIYDNLNYMDSHLSDDEYLKAHWIVYQGLNKKKGNAFIEEILEKQFSTDGGTFFAYCQNGEYAKAYDFLNDYVRSLDDYSRFWAAVNFPEHIDFDIQDDERTWIKRLSRLPDNLYMKAAIMVVLASEGVDPTDKKAFYERLEKFVFINKLLAQDRNDLSFLVTGAKELMNERSDRKQKMDALIDSIDQHSLAINADRVRKAIEAFKFYIDGKYYYYYEWNGLKYFLYEYNNSLTISSAAKIEWYKLNSASIEHVLPQTPESQYWRKAFEGYLEDDDVKRRITNSLGNLLLLSSGAENSSLKNYSFPVKKDMDVNSRKFAYRDGSRSAREIADNDYWTPKQVYDRSIKLLDFLYGNWLSEYLAKPQWDELVVSLNLVNFAKPSEEKCRSLEEDLSKIDVSEEREQAVATSVKEKKENYLSDQLRDYFDKDVFYLDSNSRQVRYSEWKYSFVIKKDKDKKPTLLKVAKTFNGVKHIIEYDYRANTIKVEYDDGSVDWRKAQDASELPEELRMFLRSLYRYIRKARQRTEPRWIV